MKKPLALLLCLAMVLALAPVALAEGYTAGVYTATVKGNNGDLTVETEFSDTEILSVKVVSHSETAGLSDAPIAQIPAAIVEKQSLAVDACSGATMTSNAIVKAVQECVAQAGGNVEDLLSPVGKIEQLDAVTTDVVVVGAGLAGLSASLSAAQNGAKVILVEKQAVTGGSGLLTGAGIYAAETDKVPAEVETKEQMYEHILEMINDGGSTDNVELDRIHHLAYQSSETIAWLEGLGMEFQVGSIGIYQAKNHYHWLADGSQGAGQVKIMDKACRDAGVEILLETRCIALNRENGAMTGITVEQGNKRFDINAKSVVIACGGYAMNKDMMIRLMPESSYSVSISNPGATGEVLDMAHKLGAAWYDHQFHLTCGLLTDSSTGVNAAPGIIVNTTGKRMMNEAKMWQLNSEAIRYATEGPIYGIYDSEYDAKNNGALAKAAEANNPYIEKGDTLEELAKRCGIEPEAFVATVNSYNSVKGTDQPDPEFGVPNDRMIFATEAPFYAAILLPLNAGTMGGIKSQITGEVLDYNGDVMTGLYACGEASNGGIYDRGYISGTSVLNAYTAGRDAGASAAAFAAK